MKCPHCGKVFANPIAQAGGKKGKRKITPEQQRKMYNARWGNYTKQNKK